MLCPLLSCGGYNGGRAASTNPQALVARPTIAHWPLLRRASPLARVARAAALRFRLGSQMASTSRHNAR
jgi:hypothetical protein